MTQTAVYRHYSADGGLLYVGASACPNCRYGTHRTQSDWGTEVARIEIDWFETREAASAAEQDQIKALKPLHNVITSTRKGKSWPSNTGHLVVQAYLDWSGTSLLSFANEIGLSLQAARKYAERVSHPQYRRAVMICIATKGYVPTNCWHPNAEISFDEVSTDKAADNLASAKAKIAGWRAGGFHRKAA